MPHVCTAVGLATFLGFGVAAFAQTVEVGPDVNPSNGHTYSVVSGWASWTAARDGAAGMGGHLVTIADQAEQDFVHAMLQRALDGTFPAWIGLTDESREGAFVWVTGEPVNYTNWAFAEPSNFGACFGQGPENYVEMIGASGEWNDTINFCDFGSAHLTIVEVEGSPPPECPCETDGNSNVIDVFDLLAYLNLWFAGDAAAERDGNPGVDVFDLLAYLDCWFNPNAVPGCEPT